MFEIDVNIKPKELQSFLSKEGWIANDEIVEVQSAGEGNMNVVLRVITDQSSFILKQSRPFVKKYPTIAAPLDRIMVENLFYQSLDTEQLGQYFPAVKAFSPTHHLMMLEDLGLVEDMTSIYRERRISDDQLEGLLDVLSKLHKQQVSLDFPDNLELRELNYQHIFVLPFLDDNGFQLDDVQPGLEKLALPLKKNKELKSKVDEIGELYLNRGNTLIHGDYYPGSWMQINDRVYVLDPEFCFPGFPEFDLGVMAAHLILTTGKSDVFQFINNKYQGRSDGELVRKVAGIEVLRRLIGLAQLPLERSLEEKTELLDISSQLVLN